MRLSDFLRTHTEQVLVEWERFARDISPDPEMTSLQLRDNAQNMLEAIADEIESLQSERERHEKSEGESKDDTESEEVDHASEVHARERAMSGFELVEMVSEYRALRASVTRLWFEQGPPDSELACDDLRRFHEAIDQSMDIAIRHYAELVDRSRQIFLAMLGHDLRNPLCAIGINAWLLTQPNGSDSAEIGKDIASCAKAMQGIIQDLLAYAGGSLGATIPVTKTDADMGVLVREVVREAQTNCSSCSIRVGDLAGDLSGRWDPVRIRQMLSNLIGNAVQHGDGTIDIHAAPEGESVLLTVRNGGKPIPQDQLAMIFNPLFRSDQSDHRVSGSLGLGLYIVKEVATAHGGTVGVSSSEGTGTVFTVRIPRHDGGDAAHAEAGTSEAKKTAAL